MMIRMIASKKRIVIKLTILCCIAALLFLYVQYHASIEETRRISIEVREGTELAFDLSPDGKTILFDLLGQIWLLPSGGGEAKAITNSILENAEHLYPTFMVNGKRIVFWESRPSSWGLTSMDLNGGERRTLTELSSSENDSYNDRFFACSPAGPEVAFSRNGKVLLLSDEERKTPVEITVEGLPGPGITDPTYTPDGSRLAFINTPADCTSHSGGQLWQVSAEGGKVQSLSVGKSIIRAPCYSPDGRSIAYFVLNEDLDFEVWVQGLDGNEARKITGHKDITPLRLRWSPDGTELIYCAEGRFWKVPVEGGQPQEIPFTVHLSFSQDRPKLKSVQFPKPQRSRVAHGHMGLEISPDGKKIAAIALGRLWIWDVGKKPTALAELPLSASGLCWSSDNTEVAWSAGVTGSEDLFATTVQTGHTRRLTAIPGTEVRASWSPDGKYIAFVYRKTPELVREAIMSGAPDRGSSESLRVLKVSDAPVADLEQTLGLKAYPMYGQTLILSQGWYWGRPWSPDSKYLLGEDAEKPALIPLEGKAISLKDSKEFPSYKPILLWEAAGSLLYTTNFSLWRSPFDTLVGMSGEPVPVSQDAALYPSVTKDGSVLYISNDGLRLRRASGQVKRLGWPLSFETASAAEPLLIRNVRIIDGTGVAISQPSDILAERGRISRIAPSGQIQVPRNITTIEADGRVAMPGMIDAHLHIWDQVLLPELLYEGITTVREMGNQMAWAKGFQESIEAGLQAGPRIVLGGFLGTFFIQPSLMGSSQPLGNPDGEEGVIRALSLARAFEFDFIKMYLVINPCSGARFIQMAHEMGFPVSSHNGYPLPLVASGINSKEHTTRLSPVTGPRVGGVLQDDIVQLVKTSGMGIVPTLSNMSSALATFDGSFTAEAGDSPFLCGWRAYGLLYPKMPPAVLKPWQKRILVGRENVARLHKAGVPLAAGTDIPMSWMPWSLHRELEEFVTSGLSPLEAITTASINAARVLRAEKEIGSIDVGKLADLVILDANPLEDIRNTRKIWKVIQGGKVVDRDALQNWTKREAEEVENIGKER
jgi:Tol biopolymer transport system component